MANGKDDVTNTLVPVLVLAGAGIGIYLASAWFFGELGQAIGRGFAQALGQGIQDATRRPPAGSSGRV